MYSKTLLFILHQSPLKIATALHLDVTQTKPGSHTASTNGRFEETVLLSYQVCATYKHRSRAPARRQTGQRQGCAFSFALACCPSNCARPPLLPRLLLPALLSALSTGEARLPLSAASSIGLVLLLWRSAVARASLFRPPKKSGVGCPVMHAASARPCAVPCR